MPQRCRVCHHQELTEIEARQRRGDSLRTMVAQFGGVTKDSLARHFANHPPRPAPTTDWTDLADTATPQDAVAVPEPTKQPSEPESLQALWDERLQALLTPRVKAVEKAPDPVWW